MGRELTNLAVWGTSVRQVGSPDVELIRVDYLRPGEIHEVYATQATYLLDIEDYAEIYTGTTSRKGTASAPRDSPVRSCWDPIGAPPIWSGLRPWSGWRTL